MRVLLLTVILCVPFFLMAQEGEQQFPYAKILKMSDEELVNAKFKFDKKRNQYVLRKTDGLNAAVNIMGAMNGSATNAKPHVDDYCIIVQKGVEGISSIEVVFYKDNIYHDILTFAADNGSDNLETTSGKTNKLQFNYQGYSFIVTRKIVVQSATSNRQYGAVSKDESYDQFSFIIQTGIKPSSEWHTKEAEKKQRDEEKGKKKKSASDFM